MLQPLLLALLAFAPQQTTFSFSGTGVSIPGFPSTRFESRFEPAAPVQYFSSGDRNNVMMTNGSGYSAVHHYYYDLTSRTYFGYDLLIEQQTQTPDTYKVSVMELGIGPLEFVGNRPGVSPTEWKKLPPPAFPAPQTLHAGDKLEITAWVDPATGQKMVDTIHLEKPQIITMRNGFTAGGQMGGFNITGGGFSAAPFARPVPSVPTVSGVARNFTADDAEMRLSAPSIKINGVPQEDARRIPAVAGSLVWFYVPKRGRYVLSLSPRPDLGFVKAGEIRGGAITFKLGTDEFALECYTPVAPGSSPYTLYVLHDPEWAPTAQNQSGQVKVGSVSPGELAMLAKK